MPCRNCLAPLPSDARFCPQCGAPVDAHAAAPDRADRLRPFVPPALAEKILAARGALEGTRRNVTVMFADLSGFTLLARALDPEAVAELLEACLADLSEPIYRFEGVIDKYMGDAIMALFGAPVAHEDDTDRALRAALAMNEALASFNRRWAARLPRPLDLHIGLNAGLVIARSIGTELYMAYTVIGDTVNLASRLADHAAAGEILVSAEVQRRAARAFQFEAAGMLRLKGLAEDVATYRLLARKPARQPARGLPGMHSPLVGRQAELETLNRTLTALAAGQGGVLWVLGEAGAGKSRLVDEARAGFAPGPQALRWLVGRSVAYEQAVPYGVFRQVLRHWLGLGERPAEAVVLARLHEELRRLIPSLAKRARVAAALHVILAVGGGDEEPVGRPDLPALQRQTFMGAAALFEALAAERPLAVLLDDLHWADELSLALLNHLQSLTLRLPLLLVCLARSDFVPAAQSGPPIPGRLTLEPLSAAQTEALIANLLGRPGAPASLLRYVADRAAGNPYYVEEMIGALVERDVLYRADEGWQLREAPEELALPASLQALVAARLDLLPPDEREVLEFAALLGRDFSFTLLNEITGRRPDLAACLDGLVQNRMIVPTDPADHLAAGYAFKHILLRDVVYDQTLNATRRRRHRAVGEALERLHAADLAGQLENLSDHFSRSDDRDKGILYSFRAAEHAHAAQAHPEAARLYQRALDLWPAGARTAAGLDYFVLSERLADARRAAGDLAAARELWLACLPAGESVTDRQSSARLLRKIGAVTFALGDARSAIDYLERGWQGAGLAFPEEGARLAAELAQVAFRQGDYPAVARWASAALAQAEGGGLPDVEAEVTNTLGAARARNGDLAGGIEYVERSLQTALSANLPRAACRAYANLGLLYGALDHDRSLNYSRRGLELAQSIGDLTIEAWLRSSMAGAYCTLGVDWQQGVLAAQAAIDLDRQLGYRSHLPVPLILMAQIYQCHGAMDSAERYYLEALEVARDLGEPQYLFPIYDGLAAARVVAGDVQGAEAMRAQAQAVLAGAGHSPEALLALPFLT